MKKHFFLTCLLLIGLFASSSAQKEANIWCFGNHCGLDFNTGSPVFFSGVALNQLEGCSSISDSSGALLFYTDGISVWNKNHFQMPNGFGLNGAGSSAQSTLIVRQPGNANLYYIYTTDEFLGPKGFSYSVVDITLQSGLGDVTVKNFNILPVCDERITAVRHANGIDTWIVTTVSSTDTIKSFLLSASGLNPVPVSSYSGSPHPGIFNYVGYLKASPSGSRLAVGFQSEGFQVFDFDNSSGSVSNPILISNSIYKSGYGVEFSPDESKLYCCCVVPTYIYQFDLNAGSSAAIIASGILIDSSTASNIGSLQLAPDGKIYLARLSSQYLGVISNPNLPGVACNYSDSGFYLASGSSMLGLPNFFPGILKSVTLPVALFPPSPPICPGTCANFTNLSSNATSYQWFFPGATPDTSTDINPQQICYNTPGSYDVTLIAQNANGSDTLTLSNYLTVLPYPPPQGVSQSGDTLFANQGAVTYQWYFNGSIISAATDYFYVAFTSGDYNVVCTDVNGCEVEAVIFDVIADVSSPAPGGTEQEIAILPNPNNGNFLIQFDGKIRATAKISVYDSIAKRIFEKEITISNEQLDLSFLQSGVYLLFIETGGKIFQKKLVKL